MTIQSSNKPAHLSFSFEQSSFQFIKSKIKQRLFQRLTRNSLNLFLRCADIISSAPQIDGVWEPHIKKLIEHYAANGYSDFFIDIGANIGLTSCQSGNKFKQVHMFEPNPDCYNILKVNTRIYLNKTAYYLYNYGLGDKTLTTTLKVPVNNWGGGFINDQTNSYSDEVLASKDRFEKIDARNYYEIEVEIRNGNDALSELFANLGAESLTSGVIKIDVEGYEPTVLMGIAQAIPKNVQTMIIFECWDDKMDVNSITSPFEGRATCYKLAKNTPFKAHDSLFIKLLNLIIQPRTHTKITKISNNDIRGDLVIEVKSIN